MKTFLTFLPAIACGAMVLACAWMMFGHRRDAGDGPTVASEELAELQGEVARLRAERALTRREEHVDG